MTSPFPELGYKFRTDLLLSSSSGDKLVSWTIITIPLFITLLLASACAVPAVEFEGYFWKPDLTMKAEVVDDDMVLPADTPPERVDELIMELRKMDIAVIEV